MNNLEGSVDMESDCEADSPEADSKTSEAREEKEGQVRAVIIAGSFCAYAHFRPVFSLRNDELYRWKSLFFYRCTDAVLFAPLKSQGADDRLKYIREKTVAAAPPPCSPKSIYVLASLVRLHPTGGLTHKADM